LTAVARLQSSDWQAWSYSLVMIAISIFSVLAGNPITLMLAWAGLDILDMVLLLSQVQDSEARQKIVASFIPRAAGILLVYWAMFAAQMQGEILDFANLPPDINLYILLAAGLRLGVLPLYVPFLQELPLRRGLGTILRLAPAASSFLLLTRMAQNGTTGSLAIILLVFALLAALYGAWGWASAEDELNGRPFWILGTAGLAVAAAINAQPGTARAWGLACLLSGGVLFLASTRPANFRLVVLLGAFGLTALPFTPGWAVNQMYLPNRTIGGAGFFIISILLLIPTQTLLLLGFLRHAWKTGSSAGGAERWVWLIYPLGLLILPLTQFILGFFDHPDLGNISIWSIVASLIPPLLAGGLFLSLRERVGLPKPFISALKAALSLNWLYRLIWLAYQGGRWVISWMNFILEGQGGLLWALLILALLFTLLIERSAGG
jgi:hypothetical protein